MKKTQVMHPLRPNFHQEGMQQLRPNFNPQPPQFCLHWQQPVYRPQRPFPAGSINIILRPNIPHRFPTHGHLFFKQQNVCFPEPGQFKNMPPLTPISISIRNIGIQGNSAKFLQSSSEFKADIKILRKFSTSNKPILTAKDAVTPVKKITLTTDTTPKKNINPIKIHRGRYPRTIWRNITQMNGIKQKNFQGTPVQRKKLSRVTRSKTRRSFPKYQFLITPEIYTGRTKSFRIPEVANSFYKNFIKHFRNIGLKFYSFKFHELSM